MTHDLRNTAMYALGLGFMALAWSKDKLTGYSTPNTVASDDLGGRIDYVHDVFDSWRRFLPDDFDLRGKDVLELCPGSSRGAGVLFLAHGARSYRAVDIFQLAARETADFHELVLDCLPQGDARPEDIERARQIVRSPGSDLFTYATGRDFDVVRLAGGRSFDLIVSCAAFEHYDDIEKTIADCTEVARPGCQSAHIVDFQTHSRWIREHDPNNIYRYPESLYRLFFFPGQPNRRRPKDYERAFRANGWSDVHVSKSRVVAPELVGPSTTGLAAPFDAPDMDMTMLDGVVLARRPN
ncbi:methyltransferase domain-containing protein [Chenggangzhangella methanolivorans]|uniref:Class I SAM-dependent methyltransferase n=1 Tax=Chenggangzhangella methanolivorans TaxID=1437009 RepID=A0A9E6R7I2_9HYPH|nr:class I SAM-dependent methyltransferase [Chenggangzhangella methanolivorans]QZN98298.1 class I SAM-dependent methyltransferase [Chenggangzhangella methanolivorans]